MINLTELCDGLIISDAIILFSAQSHGTYNYNNFIIQVLVYWSNTLLYSLGALNINVRSMHDTHLLHDK